MLSERRQVYTDKTFKREQGLYSEHVFSDPAPLFLKEYSHTTGARSASVMLAPKDPSEKECMT